MGLDNKVVWSEGMFLRTQHFQQQDRYAEQLVRTASEGMVPFPWGFDHLKINRAMLVDGAFHIEEASGVFADGTPFRIPEDATVEPLKIESVKGREIVYLAMPEKLSGQPEIGSDVSVGSEGGLDDGADGLFEDGDGSGGMSLKRGVAATRYGQQTQKIRDTIDGFTDQETEIIVGKPRLTLALGDRLAAGYSRIAIARIEDVRSTGEIVLEETFIPTCRVSAVSNRIAYYMTALSGALKSRSTELSAILGDRDSARIANIGDLLFFQVCNRYRRIVSHYTSELSVHPYTLFCLMLEMSGELATFAVPRQVPADPPPYRHPELVLSLEPLFQELYRLLSQRGAAQAVRLEVRQVGTTSFYYSPVPDKDLVRNSTFVLGVRHRGSLDQLRRRLPSLATIGASNDIRRLVGHFHGIHVENIDPPAEVRPDPNTAYFRLMRDGPRLGRDEQARMSEQWQKVETSDTAFAFHIAGVGDTLFEIELEFFAIRVPQRDDR